MGALYLPMGLLASVSRKNEPFLPTKLMVPLRRDVLLHKMPADNRVRRHCGGAMAAGAV